MLLHRESVDGAVEPGGWPLDERAATQLAPQAQDRLLERIGRLLISQTQVAREVIERGSMSIMELGHHRRVVDDVARLAAAGRDGLQARHTT